MSFVLLKQVTVSPLVRVGVFFDMAKELPYFKFEPSQWENGSIQVSTFEAQGVFINLCSMYWQRLGDLPYKLAVQKICKGNATAFDSLVTDHIIKVIDGMICIDFLNEQLDEFENNSKTNSENARLGWQKRRKNATAKQSQSDGNAIKGEEIRGDKRKEEKKREENIIHEIAATKVATIEDRQKVFMEKLTPYLPDYSKEMLREFFDYWVEKNDGGRKMRFEMQKVFDIQRRLKTWSKNNNDGARFNKTGGNGSGKTISDLINSGFGSITGAKG